MGGVSRFEDLEAWKLASELSGLLRRMTDSGRAAADPKFREQIRESSASAASNIAEGWSRFYPRENAQFVRWAKGSLGETLNHLLHGNRQGYFSADDFDQACSLCRRALGATSRYVRYLESCEGEVPGQPPRSPRKRGRSPNPQPPSTRHDRAAVESGTDKDEKQEIRRGDDQA